MVIHVETTSWPFCIASFAIRLERRRTSFPVAESLLLGLLRQPESARRKRPLSVLACHEGGTWLDPNELHT